MSRLARVNREQVFSCLPSFFNRKLSVAKVP